ncbi:MAG: hypothetical protein ACE5G1_16760, partial [bacterium]
QLEQELSKSRNYDARKNDAVKVIGEHFKMKADGYPTDAEVKKHFIKKWYTYTDINLKILSHYSLSVLSDSFYQFVDKALFALHQRNTAEATNLFAKAEQIANHLKNTFMIDYLNFARALSGEDLGKKLQAETYYERVNTTLAEDVQKGIELIATGLALTDQISDMKRTLDFLGKCQYVLYNCETLPHSAMSLGHYLISQTSHYQELQLWSHFHNGNIWLGFDLNIEKKFTNNQAAKQAFQAALKLANALCFQTARMVLNERLAITCRRESDFPAARQYFEDSLGIGRSADIPHTVILQNTVRCLTGLGILDYLTAKNGHEEKETLCQSAEKHFKQAAKLANELRYYDNQAAALSNLGNLYRFWNKKNLEKAKNCHKMSYDIQTEILGLDQTLERVQWNRKHQ